MRSERGAVSLVDFGGVKLAAKASGGSTVVGTFGYMAPEQRHGEATPRTDLDSLGATLAALATGRETDALPRRGLTLALGGLVADATLRELIGRLTEADPDQRPGSVEAVQAWLARQAEPEPGPQPNGRRDAAPEPSTGDRFSAAPAVPDGLFGARIAWTLWFVGAVATTACASSSACGWLRSFAACAEVPRGEGGRGGCETSAEVSGQLGRGCARASRRSGASRSRPAAARRPAPLARPAALPRPPP